MPEKPFEEDKPRLNIEQLLVTQNGLRSHSRVAKMCDYILTGGIFTFECIPLFHQDENRFSLIRITRFPGQDGDVYVVQDGHHRLVSMALSGRTWLDPREYLIQDFTHGGMFDEINFAVGWVTPFNILTELRLPDIVPFKTKVLAMTEQEATAYILANKHEYAQARNGMHTVNDLAKCVNKYGCLNN